jgi:osmotically-inducible protein OsmY
MAPLAGFLTLLRREPTRSEIDSPQGTAPLLPQGPDDPGLAECVERALRSTGYGTLRAVAVTVRAKVVTLEGRVPTYYLKQIAQETALSVPGIDMACNNLDVGRQN